MNENQSNENKAIIEKTEKLLKVASKEDKTYLLTVVETLATRALINQEQQSA